MGHPQTGLLRGSQEPNYSPPSHDGDSGANRSLELLTFGEAAP